MNETLINIDEECCAYMSSDALSIDRDQHEVHACGTTHHDHTKCMLQNVINN